VEVNQNGCHCRLARAKMSGMSDMGGLPPGPPPPGAMPPVPQGAGFRAGPPPLPGGAVLASYGQRVGAYLIDALIALLLTVPGTAVIVAGALAGGGDEPNGVLIALGVPLILAGVAVHVWNQGWRQGASGQSWGKGFTHVRLVRAADGRPPGGPVGLGRWFLRQLLGNASGGVYTIVTLLWPLWDERRQTLDDKILSTLVVQAP
jgi:uncharacterized RDD family membrane protein YckC